MAMLIEKPDFCPQPRSEQRKNTNPVSRPHRRKGRPGFWAVSRQVLWSWWVWALAAMTFQIADQWEWTIVSGMMAMLTYLIAPQEQSPRYGLDVPFAVESDDFVSSMVGTTGVPVIDGNKLDILNNGDEFFPAMVQAIEAAEYSITIEAYIYWAGEIGGRFAEALAERGRNGVKVKILLDAVGSSTIGDEILNKLQCADCKVAWYNPVGLSTIGRFNHRTHRKSLVVDGRVAFTGGAGIADEWMGNAQDPEHWRDLQIRIEGPGVLPLQTGFAQNWLNTTGELVSGGAFFPRPERVGPLALQTIMSSPETGSSSVRIMYYLSIVCARRSIYLANPYFVPDEAAVEILIEAKKRGVDVRIMVAGTHNDMRITRYSGIQLYGKLLKAGIEIYEYRRTMMHQKTMVVDGVWTTIGTANFDNRSFALNEESNVCAYNRALALRLERIFMEDLKVCDRIDLETWKKRSIFTKVTGTLALFLKEQI
jgi:cardiolipin synthase